MKRRRWLRALRIEVIHLKPSDVLVVSTDHTLSRDQWAELSTQLATHFPDHKHIGLPPGWSIRPIRGEGTDDDAHD